MKIWLSQRVRNFFKKFGLLILVSFIFLSFLIFLRNTQVLPQGAISLIEEIEEIKHSDRILIFSPHPDDETLCCGGLISKAKKNGAEVFVVLVTDGNGRGLKTIRNEEFLKVMELFKIQKENIFFLNFGDKKLALVDPKVLEKSFEEVILKTQPTIVIFPVEEDNHKDHRITSEVLKTLLKNPHSFKNYQYLIHHNYFPQPWGYHPYFYLLPPLKILKFNYHFKKLTLDLEEITLKKQAIYTYQSQLKTFPLKEILPSFIKLNELFIEQR
ncbi:MAG: PIG-L deacetylase family protein [Candidatus Paceibacterota bacterium]